MTVASGLTEVTDQNWDALVRQASRPVLVDHWAVWCPPCRAMSAMLAEVAQRYPNALDVVSVNADENPAIAGRQRILAMPTLQLFRNGELLWQVVGARSRSRLLTELREHVALP